MESFTWQFPRNEAGEHEGPNDAGITHFTGSRKDGVIRETLQNSLDARRDLSKPVKVKFEITSKTSADFAVPSLIEALKAAVRSPDNDDAHRAQFERGIKMLSGGGRIQCLSVTDSNTTGADDETRPNDAPSKWEALTKGVGSNAKDQRDAAGSFGLGKFAAFAVSDIRTVLYSVAYLSDGKLLRRFQGRTIIVSHQTDGGEKRRRIGYLGDYDFRPLVDVEVPRLSRAGQRHYRSAVYTCASPQSPVDVIMHPYNFVLTRISVGKYDGESNYDDPKRSHTAADARLLALGTAARPAEGV